MGHLLLVSLGFLCLQALYAFLSQTVRTPGWQESIGLLLWDRLNYALSFGLLGYVLFFQLIPRRGLVLRQFVRIIWFREYSFEGRLRALLWGLSSGLLVFGMLYVYESRWGEASAASSHLSRLFAERPLLFGAHLLASGLCTPLLEEWFYRACLSGHLERAFLSVSDDPNSGVKGYLVLVIFFPVLLFAWVHPSVPFFMLALGSLFTILYWKGGLVSAMAAHAVYNGLILFASTRWG